MLNSYSHHMDRPYLIKQREGIPVHFFLNGSYVFRLSILFGSDVLIKMQIQFSRTSKTVNL